MSGGANAARLDALTRELAERWRQTRDTWRDTKAREFEERFMDELESAVQSAVTAIEQLEVVLGKIRSDCE